MKLRKLFKLNNNNVYGTLYPIFIVSKIFGLAPYKYLINRSKSTWILSNLTFIQTVLYIFIIIIFTWPATDYQMQNLNAKHKNVISIYSDICRTVSNTITALFILTIMLKNRGVIVNLIEKIHKLDEKLHSLKMNVNDKNPYSRIIILILIVYTGLFIILLVDLKVCVNWDNILSFIHWCGCIFGFLIGTTATLKFVCILYIIYNRFKLLNSYISANCYSEMTIQKRKPGWKTSRVFDIYHDKNISYISPVYIDNNFSENISKIFDKLCNLTKRLNSIYSLHILLCTSTTFIVLVTQLYIFYLMLSSNENYILTYPKAWTATIWGILLFGNLFSISYICTLTKEEADTTSILLHKIKIDEHNDTLKTKVEMFSLQMMHQKVEFSACGFFPVDFSVLYMIMGAVTTYLVFLIQFEMANRSLMDQKLISNIFKNNTYIANRNLNNVL